MDTAYGGDSFVIVDAEPFGFKLTPNEARDIVQTGLKITNAANEQLGFHHPGNPDWKHIPFCQIAAPLQKENGAWLGCTSVVIQPGKLDRWPTGTGCSARMALWHHKGILKVGDQYIGESILDSRFHCSIDAVTTVGEREAIYPLISGQAWITGTHQHMLDPTDPWPEGYRVADTWPMLEK